MRIDQTAAVGTQPLSPAGGTGALSPGAASSSVGTRAIEGDFASILGDAISQMSQQLRKAETVSVAGVKGVASTQEVVEQVMAAEQMLQASIAVRDKIVAAYLEVSRMTI